MLLSGWFLALLVVLAATPTVALAAAEAVRHRRRRQGRATLHGWNLALVRTTAVALTLAVGLAAVADEVNRHFSYIPSFAALFGNVSADLVHRPLVDVLAGAARGPMPSLAHGTVVLASVRGPVSGIGGRPTYVYLPPQYFSEPGRRFPVLYLLHGAPGTSVDWLRGGNLDVAMDRLLRAGAIDPFLVVMPDFNGGYTHDTECVNSSGGQQVETYLAVDVVHWVDAHFRTLRTRTARAIGGLSTGGYCGINLTFRDPSVFSAAVSHSGADHPDHNFSTGDLFHRNHALQAANTPRDYLTTVPIRRPTGLYLDAGSAETGVVRESEWMAREARRRGVVVAFHVFPKEHHTYSAWRHDLYFSLPWVSDWFAHPGADHGVPLHLRRWLDVVPRYVPGPNVDRIFPRLAPGEVARLHQPLVVTGRPARPGRRAPRLSRARRRAPG